MILRTITGIAAAAAVIISLSSAAVFSDEGVSENSANPMEDYQSLSWMGDKLYYDDYSTALYFAGGDKDIQTAVVAVDIEQGMTGAMFRVDAGNGSGAKDSGFCSLTFYDGEHNALFGVSSGVISGLNYYTRFSIGTETSYYPIPDGAKTAEIVLSAEQKGDSKRVDMYFRNLALYFSKEVPLAPAEKDKLYMDASTGLSIVEVGVTAFERYLWVVVVFLVALAFFIISVWRQKYKTPKVMKGSDRKRR